MRLIDIFTKEYQELYTFKPKEYSSDIEGLVKKVKDTLLEDRFLPSLPLKNVLKKLESRAKEPMKVAITGQFSSGKSTFLNALMSRAVLPTGITPVTSKVNFIRYGKEFMLKVTYKNGAEQYQEIEDLARFTDQRNSVEDIKYLSIYAPIPMLKEIVFVDTPGLNSQSKLDTQTTTTILRDVDGIIWLSLIDNAGKMSEHTVLKEFMGNYQNKSLCVLNQKDRFSKDEVEKTIRYVKENFGEFFADVIAISATEALESRKHQKEVLLQEAKESFSKIFLQSLDSIDQRELLTMLQRYEEQKASIVSAELFENVELLHQSNIEQVIEFIETKIRPKANEAKEFAIKKDLLNVCELLIEQNGTFITLFERIEKLFEDFEHSNKEAFIEANANYSKRLQEVFYSFEKIIQKISDEIYTNIKAIPRYRYEESKKIFSKSPSISKVAYEISFIDSDSIYKNLFYDDETIDRMFKKANKELSQIASEVEVAITQIYSEFEEQIKQWQHTYELLRKSREIWSDLEFANIRKFASKSYENFLMPLYSAHMNTIASMRNDFGYISGALLFGYQNATKVTVAFFKRKIAQSIEIYESNPQKFSLYRPTLDEIQIRLKINFSFDTLENLMKSKQNFLYKNINALSSDFEKICEEKIEFLEQKKSRYIQLNKDLSLKKSNIQSH